VRPAPDEPQSCLEKVSLVRLADVEEFLRCGDGILGHLRERSPDIEETLHGQQLVEADAETVQHSELLGLGLGLHLGDFLSVLGPVELQLAGGNDGLVDKHALHFAGGAGGADPVGLVADRWVGVEAGLFGPALGGLDVGGSLGEGGVVLDGHLLQISQSERGRWGGLRKGGTGRRFLLGNGPARHTGQGDKAGETGIGCRGPLAHPAPPTGSGRWLPARSCWKDRLGRRSFL
jgi:hypothetical protein